MFRRSDRQYNYNPQQIIGAANTHLVGNGRGLPPVFQTMPGAVVSFSTTNVGTGEVYNNTAWNLVTLNNEDLDASSIVTLAAGVLTLTYAGIYIIDAFATAYHAATAFALRARLYDVTNAAVLMQGPQIRLLAAEVGVAPVSMYLAAATSLQIKLEVYPNGTNTQAQPAVSSGEREQFAVVRVVKLI